MRSLPDTPVPQQVSRFNSAMEPSYDAPPTMVTKAPSEPERSVEDVFRKEEDLDHSCWTVAARGQWDECGPQAGEKLGGGDGPTH
jgi:hypothetical protein